MRHAAVAAAVALLAVCEATGTAGEPSPEALVARGIEHWNNRKMREGLEELRAAVATRPDWLLAERALGAALLRAGKDEEARQLFARLVGEEEAEGMAEGGPAALSPDAVAEDLMGLAVAEERLGHRREAERLYRAFADIVGPTEPEAARAYSRIGKMFEGADGSWVDGEAELAKALALDPDLDVSDTAPGFPNPRAVPELEPYVRDISLSGSSGDSAAAYESLPVLESWVAPPDSIRGARSLARGDIEIDILVGPDGVPTEVFFPPAVSEAVLEHATAGPDTVGQTDGLSRLAAAVMLWRFEPAVRDGAPAEALITFGGTGERGAGGRAAGAAGVTGSAGPAGSDSETGADDGRSGNDQDG
jgi:hypothetical protein